MIIPCQNEEDFRRLLADSTSKPVFLLKHSTRCPISAGAQRRYNQFAEEHADIDCWLVLVIEQRAISNLISAETGIPHHSPQAMLFRACKPVWHESHHGITGAALESALGNAE